MPRRSRSNVCSVMYHLRRSLLQLIRLDSDLRDILDRLLRCTLHDSIVDLIRIAEVRTSRQLPMLILLQILEISNQRLVGRILLLSQLISLSEELAQLILMHRRLSERLGDDGGLLPLDAKHELDHGMQEARVQPLEEVLGLGIVLLEDVLRQDLAPALGLDLGLVESEEGGVVLALAEILGRGG